ncbi:MAG: hypothetical protein M3Z04_12805 [Chloroflexota bacterium]|nr:hypothetical protein [Chloroflexota bacterium]
MPTGHEWGHEYTNVGVVGRTCLAGVGLGGLGRCGGATDRPRMGPRIHEWAGSRAERAWPELAWAGPAAAVGRPTGHAWGHEYTNGRGAGQNVLDRRNALFSAFAGSPP